MVDLSRHELKALCERALVGAGAAGAQARILAEATVQAELLGRGAVGVSHLFDYLDGFGAGRISSMSVPNVEHLTSVVSTVDCQEGIAQHGFQLALPALCAAAGAHGLAVAALRRCFTAGELDYYVRALNRCGLMGLAFANSPALMTVAGSRGPLLGSNPMAFGVPLPASRRLAVDQASSATAWVTLRDAALSGDPIPATWAVDGTGNSTTSAAAGLAGALLPFGGYKGGNVALLVELLATLTGGRFSSEAPPFNRGTASPSVGVVVVAVSVATLNPGYVRRLADQLERWKAEYGADPTVWTEHHEGSSCSLTGDVHDRLREFASKDAR